MVTVASLNLGFCRTTDGRPLDVAAACRRLDADVVALQEVWGPPGEPSPAARAAADLGWHVHEAVVPRPDAHRGTYGLAVLTRGPSVAGGAVDLGRIRGDASRRVALPVTVALADGVAGPGPVALTVVCTHLTHRLWGSGRHLRRLRRALPDARAGTPAVVLGDLNMWGPVVVAILRGWRRAVRGRTWPAHRPHSQIDHVLVTPTVDVVAGAVLPPVGSDHRPVRAVLRVPGPA